MSITGTCTGILFYALIWLLHVKGRMGCSPDLVRCRVNEPRQSVTVENRPINLLLDEEEVTSLVSETANCTWHIKGRFQRNTSKQNQLLVEVLADNASMSDNLTESLDLRISYSSPSYDRFGYRPVRLSATQPKIFILDDNASVIVKAVVTHVARNLLMAGQQLRLRLSVIRTGFCGDRSLVHSSSICFGVRRPLNMKSVSRISVSPAERSVRLAHFRSAEQITQFVTDVKLHNSGSSSSRVNLTSPVLIGLRYCHRNSKLMFCNCTSANSCVWEPFLYTKGIKMDCLLGADDSAEISCVTLQVTGAAESPKFGLASCDNNSDQLLTLWGLPDFQAFNAGDGCDCNIGVCHAPETGSTKEFSIVLSIGIVVGICCILVAAYIIYRCFSSMRQHHYAHPHNEQIGL